MLDISRLLLSPANLPLVTVGVCQHDHGRHVGVTYRAKGVAMFLHQAWHKYQAVDLLDDVWKRFKGQFVFAAPDIEPDRAKAVSGFCRAIARDIATGESQIGYALQYDPDALVDRHTGKLALPNGKGLTCVTYVLVIFKSAKLPIIDFEGWPERPADLAAHTNLLDALCKDLARVEHEHCFAVAKELRCVRCRPEEICGACLCMRPGSPAIKHAHAEPAGEAVIGSLSAQPQVL
jgi:hypothetical protein